MRFAKLTMHQREKLTEVRAAKVAVLLAPAGGGKTFVAVQRVVQVLSEATGATVLFVARNEALALFFCKWLVIATRKSAEHVVERIHVLVAPFEDHDACASKREADGGSCLGIRESTPRRTRSSSSTRRTTSWATPRFVRSSRILALPRRASCSSATPRRRRRRSPRTPSRARSWNCHRTKKLSWRRSPRWSDRRSELSRAPPRSSSRPGARPRRRLTERRRGRRSWRGSLRLSKGDDAGETYAREVVEALAAIRRQLVDLEDLDDRVAVVGPDEAFIEKLREPLARALGGFELVDAATASAVLPRGDTEARAADAKQLLVVDSVDNMDGLERLVVICVGLDQVIDRGAGVLETRSRLYRAMTRAQLAVAVVNEALPGGWLEFLGRVELDGGKFDDAAERENRAETAADDVVGAVVEETSAPVATRGDATARALVSKAPSAPARGSDGAQQASPNDAVGRTRPWRMAAESTRTPPPPRRKPNR